MAGPYMGKAPQLQDPFEGNFVGRAVFTLGTPSAGVQNVSVQLFTGPNDLYDPGAVNAYLSDNADGSSIAASAPNGGWAIGTDGLLIPLVANKYATFVSESDGVFDVNVTDSNSGKLFYMVVILPDGSLSISDAITATP